MASFTLGDITLRIPGKALGKVLREDLESGRYEWNEAAAIRHHVKQGDRVLDLGAGAGYISILAGQKAGAENVIAVDGNPMMAEALRHNLDRNGAEETMMLEGAVVADSYDEETVLYAQRPAFWSAGLAQPDTNPEVIVEVPALPLSELFEAYKPTVVSMDVEGGELELCQQIWPDYVRLVIMEIHPNVYGSSGTKALVDGMSDNNFTLHPRGTRGEVIVWRRVVDD